MKKIGLGIAIILFGILLAICIDGLEFAALGIGVVGFFFALSVCGNDKNE